MAIKVTYKDNDLTIFTIIDELNMDELMALLQSIYQEKPTLNFLWDIRKGSIKQLSSENLAQIATFVKSVSGRRQAGRTAFVVARDVDYGIGRMLDAYGENEGLPIETRVFRNYVEAVVWLERKLE